MPLATADDIATRLGRDLTAGETDQATAAITTVTGLIADVAVLTVAELEALDPMPPTLVALCVEKAMTAVVNPNGVATTMQQLGAYQESTTFPRAMDVGLLLTYEEERRVRRAVGGVGFVAVTLETPYSGDSSDDLPDLPL